MRFRVKLYFAIIERTATYSLRINSSKMKVTTLKIIDSKHGSFNVLKYVITMIAFEWYWSELSSTGKLPIAHKMQLIRHIFFFVEKPQHEFEL